VEDTQPTLISKEPTPGTVEPGPEGREAGASSGGMVRFLLDILETLILSVVLFVGINYVTARIRVDGSSMEPSFQSGQLILVNRLAYRIGEPLRGDVIVFNFPRNPTQEYIKRLIGLPGDHIEVRDGQVLVNNIPIDEPYIAAAPRYTGEWTIPEEQYFVLGDNRNNSSDSHSWGMVPADFVIGKALAVYWPVDDWQLIPSFPHNLVTP
jgi:signal peptidase I